MKTSLKIALALGISGAFLFLHPSSPVFAQGALTPPGAPAPTMKSLDQIEPRTAISSLPFTISTSGSYYLTRSLTAAGSGAGITVSADDVTIDLNGFALTGNSAEGVQAINLPATRNNFCVRNGSVNNWVEGIKGYATGGIYEKLNFKGNQYGLLAGSSSRITDCAANASSGVGITVQDNSVVENCTLSGSIFGIRVRDNCIVRHCTASGGARGVDAENTVGCLIVDCVFNNNSNYGIYLGSFSIVRGCTISRNTLSGIVGSSGNRIEENVITLNNSGNIAGQAGVRISGSDNRIDSNDFTNNGYAGLDARSSGAGHDLIIRNTFTGAQMYYDAPGDTVGPFVDTVASGGTISNTSPWANFGFH